MVDIVLLLGSVVQSVAFGMTFIFWGGALSRALRRSKTNSKDQQTVTFQVEVPGLTGSALGRYGLETWEDHMEVIPAEPIESLPPFHHRDDLASCPCGLQLPLEALIEHMQSTGHAGVVSFGSVRAGKIWDLEQAIIEGTSPDCYKCGKPVTGLKRVGRTIYVSHLGCIEASKARRSRRIGSESSLDVASDEGRRSIRTTGRKRCPICWKLVRKRGSTEALSSTGGFLRFHNSCLQPDTQGRSIRFLG